MLRQAAAAGKLTLPHPADPERGCGLFVAAMGKMGACELNYSSDIDIIVFFDPDIAPLAPGVEAGPLFVRLTRALIRLLQHRTEHGYVFRVDVRLRPDPSSTQVAMSVPAALDYYESRGQNWERAAWIKARICAGDRVAGAAHFDVGEARGKELIAALRARLPGYLVPRLAREIPGELSKTVLA